MFFWNGLVWPFEWKALVSLRHDLDGNPGLSAAAHRHQVSFGIIFQAGWFRVCSPLELWVQHHPYVGCADSASTPSPSISPCAPTVSGESSWYLSIYDLLFISACADHMDWSALKYRRRQLLASLHWCGAWGDTCGGKLALRAAVAGGRRHVCLYGQTRNVTRLEFFQGLMVMFVSLSDWQGTAQRSLKGDRWQVSGELESGVWLLLVSTFLANSIYFNLSLKKTIFLFCCNKTKYSLI